MQRAPRPQRQLTLSKTPVDAAVIGFGPQHNTFNHENTKSLAPAMELPSPSIAWFGQDNTTSPANNLHPADKVCDRRPSVILRCDPRIRTCGTSIGPEQHRRRSLRYPILKTRNSQATRQFRVNKRHHHEALRLPRSLSLLCGLPRVLPSILREWMCRPLRRKYRDRLLVQRTHAYPARARGLALRWN